MKLKKISRGCCLHLAQHSAITCKTFTLSLRVLNVIFDNFPDKLKLYRYSGLHIEQVWLSTQNIGFFKAQEDWQNWQKVSTCPWRHCCKVDRFHSLDIFRHDDFKGMLIYISRYCKIMSFFWDKSRWFGFVHQKYRNF